MSDLCDRVLLECGHLRLVPEGALTVGARTTCLVCQPSMERMAVKVEPAGINYGPGFDRSGPRAFGAARNPRPTIRAFGMPKPEEAPDG